MLKSKHRKYLSPSGRMRRYMHLLANRGRVVSYDRFLHVLDEELSDGALKNLILRLRKKVGDEAEIKNLSKIGYKLT